jgi:hypothetical protein
MLPKKLLDQMRAAIRRNHYSFRKEESYVDQGRHSILFHRKRYLNERWLRPQSIRFSPILSPTNKHLPQPEPVFRNFIRNALKPPRPFYPKPALSLSKGRS